ncbi:MAG: DUF4252 domain-containing protein [Candidatus Latescibacteria bacterium]|nr:DUF4252 domain-containing protein [Candidatus Latescibacterota bacterium]
MKRTTYAVCGTLVIAIVAVACGARAAEEPANLPGYVDFESMGMATEAEATVEVLLKGSLLSLVREAAKNHDPEASEFLSQLRAVRVLKYPQAGQNEVNGLATLGQKLAGAGWDKIARVDEDEHQALVYVKEGDEKILGLVAAVVKPDDGTYYVNVVGEIDPAQIGKLGGKFNIPGFEHGKAKQCSKSAEKH